ncbi:MAG: flagellar protein FlaG [Treponema sp.]|nr:flagellar protein FlaG [Treponema sp.]
MSTVASVGFVSQMPLPDSLGQPAKSEKVRPQVQQTQIVDLERIGNALSKKLQFVVDHSSNDVVIKVIDKETDRVIKEIPPEELQRLHRNLREAIGLLFNEMV